MTLYVEESGTPGAPSIVFLHGVGASGWMWWQQVAALTDFHCLNVDLPGHGKSNHIPWRSLTDTADQIASIIHSRATNRRAHVVGLSLGGYIALRLLERHSALLDRVVISGVTSAPMPNRALLTPQLWLMSVMKIRWIAQMQAQALPLPPAMQSAFVDNLRAMSIQTYRTIMTEAVDFSAPSALQHVPTPTLITAGGSESKIILQSVAAIPELMPNAQGCLAPRLGHGWNVEAPDLFSAMVRAWLTDAPLPPELQMVHATVQPVM